MMRPPDLGAPLIAPTAATNTTTRQSTGAAPGPTTSTVTNNKRQSSSASGATRYSAAEKAKIVLKPRVLSKQQANKMVLMLHAFRNDEFKWYLLASRGYSKLCLFLLWSILTLMCLQLQHQTPLMNDSSNAWAITVARSAPQVKIANSQQFWNFVNFNLLGMLYGYPVKYSPPKVVPERLVEEGIYESSEVLLTQERSIPSSFSRRELASEEQEHLFGPPSSYSSDNSLGLTATNASSILLQGSAALFKQYPIGGFTMTLKRYKMKNGPRGLNVLSSFGALEDKPWLTLSGHKNDGMYYHKVLKAEDRMMIDEDMPSGFISSLGFSIRPWGAEDHQTWGYILVAKPDSWAAGTPKIEKDPENSTIDWRMATAGFLNPGEKKPGPPPEEFEQPIEVGDRLVGIGGLRLQQGTQQLPNSPGIMNYRTLLRQGDIGGPHFGWSVGDTVLTFQRQGTAFSERIPYNDHNQGYSVYVPLTNKLNAYSLLSRYRDLNFFDIWSTKEVRLSWLAWNPLGSMTYSSN